MFDPELYRDKSEIAEWKQRDPVHGLENRMKAASWITPDAFDALDAEVTREIDAAVAFAERGTWEPVETLTEHVYTPDNAHA